jgi:hypothetical protein
MKPIPNWAEANLEITGARASHYVLLFEFGVADLTDVGENFA